MRFLQQFRRFTNSGDYLPEVDGLRFVAIFLVAFCMHLGSFIRELTLGIPFDHENPLHMLLHGGGYGVSLFFMISGFILSVPFAKQKILGQQEVNLKGYFIRRLTRIEPPYLVSMVIYLAVRVWILKYESLETLLPHFFASVLYIHNWMYGYASLINGVAWSLEVEIQFYILAPLLTQVYLVRHVLLRRAVLLGLIIIGSYFTYAQPFTVSIIDKGAFFICGMLLADVYVTRGREWNGWGIALGVIIAFILFQFVPGLDSSVTETLVKMLATTVMFYFCLTNAQLKRVLSIGWVTVIGGMCYSIYLVHMGIYGLMRHGFFQYRFTGNNTVDIALHYAIGIVAVLVPSAIFFLIIEKPTMKRDWYKGIFTKRNG